MESTNRSRPSSSSSELDNKLVKYLNDMLSVENAVIDRLQTRIDKCLLPEGKKQLQHHLEETREQQQRLYRMISNRGGGKPTDAKADLPTLDPSPAMMAVKTLTDVAKAVTGGEVSANPIEEEEELRKTKEDFGLENIEILSYRMLIMVCEKLGLQEEEEASLLNKSLQEEQEMANWISTNMPATFDALWPRIEEAAMSGQNKDRPKGRTTTTTTPPPAASA